MGRLCSHYDTQIEEGGNLQRTLIRLIACDSTANYPGRNIISIGL
jgi:hypothetical protein